MTTLTARWSCYACDATGEGPRADKDAEKHTRGTGHATCVYGEIPADKARNTAGKESGMIDLDPSQMKTGPAGNRALTATTGKES